VTTGTDYDARTRPAVGVIDSTDSIDELRSRRTETQSPSVDVEDPEAFELPGADLLDEELTVPVVPMSAYEFRCSRCFLVHHQSQRVPGRNGDAICRDCA